MRKQGGTPPWRDEHVTLAAISPPGAARGRFVEGHQPGQAGCKPPILFMQTVGRLSRTRCTYPPMNLQGFCRPKPAPTETVPQMRRRQR